MVRHTHTKTAWHDHCRWPASLLASISWQLEDSSSSQIATVAQRGRICGLLLVLQRFSTGKHRSLPPGIPFTVVLMLDVHYSRNAKEISDLCVCQLTAPHHHRLIPPPSPPRSSFVVATFNLFNASPGLRRLAFCNLALELARFQSDHHSPEGTSSYQ